MTKTELIVEKQVEITLLKKCKNAVSYNYQTKGLPLTIAEFNYLKERIDE